MTRAMPEGLFPVTQNSVAAAFDWIIKVIKGTRDLIRVHVRCDTH